MLIVPAGARWYKFEFHCHTPKSEDYGKGPNQATLKQLTPEEWLLGYMAAEIDCVAITDHNTGAWIDTLKASYEQMKAKATSGFRELVIFPGVEISCQSNVHMLALFGPDATSVTITRLLGAVGYKGQPGQSDGVTDLGVQQVCEKINEHHGMAIPAHVDEASGVFKELRGTTLESLLKCDALAAIEISDPCYLRERRSSIIAPKPPLPPGSPTVPQDPNEQLYKNFRAYEQTSPAIHLAEVVGSDAHHPSGPVGKRFPGCRFTWVKMGAKPSLEGLRLALHDGRPLSIRRSDEEEVPFNPSAPVMQESKPPIDPNVWAANTIESLTISNGQYVGRGEPLELKLSPWLNCVVGGRGSGKSTVVEMARLALSRDEELTATGEPERNFQAFAQVYDKKRTAKGEPPGALTTDTDLSLIYRVGASRYRLLWRQDGDEPSIEEEHSDGTWTSAKGEITSRFPVKIYSQKQVYSLARNSVGLLRVINNSSEVGYAEWKARWNQELAKFLELRANARSIEAGFAEETRITGLLDDVKKKLTVFEKAGHADVLTQYQRYHRQKLRMNEIIEEAEPLQQSVLKVIDGIELPTLEEETFADAKGLDELKAENDKLIAVIEKARSELRRIKEELSTALVSFGEGVWKTTWAKTVEDVEKKFDELKRQLEDVGTNDPNEYEQLVKQRQGHETELKKIEEQKKQLQSVKEEYVASYKRLGELRRELTQKRSAFLIQALKGNKFVRMTVIPYGDFSGVEEAFRSKIGKEGTTFAKDILQDEGVEQIGLLSKLYEGYKDPGSTEINDFEKKLHNLKNDISKANKKGEMEGHTRHFVKHLSNMQPEEIDRIFAWWPDDSLKIEYNNGSGDGKWRSISEGSPGQKTAAMLAFLLSYGTEPMILDQPEDDLDNHLIYDLIVSQIRQNKTKRQIIIVTHNPNIVVNGDAEFVVAMDFKSGQCCVWVQGCLQEKAVRDEICRVMEGGREAFEKRYRRVILENK